MTKEKGGNTQISKIRNLSGAITNNFTETKNK